MANEGGNLLLQAFNLFQQRRFAEAESLFKIILAKNANDYDAAHYFGLLKATTGDITQAKKLLELSLGSKNNYAAYVENYASILFQAGDYAKAEKICLETIKTRGGSESLQYILAISLFRLHKLNDSISAFDRLLGQFPRNFVAHNEMAGALAELGKFDQALHHIDKALQLSPAYPEAFLNKGNVLAKLQRNDEAIANFTKAVQAKPLHEGYLGLGNVLTNLRRFDEALPHYDKALAINPGSAKALLGKSNILFELNLNDAACRELEKIGEGEADFAQAQGEICFMQTPIVYEREAQIDDSRARYEAHLKSLDEYVRRVTPSKELQSAVTSRPPFYLAYQGRNDRELQELYGSVVAKAASYADADHVPRIPSSAANTKIRVGLVSDFFRAHSNWKIPIKGWLSQIDRSKFDIFGYHLSAKWDSETDVAASLCDRFVHGKTTFDDWRNEIISGAPDVLIYPGLLMESMSTQLAAHRLAPVQCNSWGHPDTSGLPTIDYYLSSDLMEPADGAAHYTEQLVRLSNLSIYYEPINFNRAKLSRAEFGLRENGVIFWCAQSLHKYLPRHDDVFPRIATSFPDCQFVFVKHHGSKAITEVFQKRLEGAFSRRNLKYESHCVFLPVLSQDEFLTAMGLSDVFLDSIEWSGCNSTLESLTHNLPIVTFRGNMMRGRHTSAILEMMGITHTITDTLDDYVDCAVRLAASEAGRRQFAELIAANKHKVFKDQSTVRSLEEFLYTAVRRRA